MIRTAIHTDVGPRENLEDTAMASVITGPGGTEVPILVVCDGVGGHSAGEVASALALAHTHGVLAAYLAGNGFPLDDALDSANLADVIGQSLITANQAVIEQTEHDVRCRDMGTTVVCAVVVGETLVAGWAGDSRCYVYNDGRLVRLTRDHSQVEDLIEKGLVTTEEAKTHPAAHTITRYLGQRDNFEPEVRLQRISPGDVILMCTDGLTDVLSDRDIESHIASYCEGGSRFDDLPGRLVADALAVGTHDNTTVLCCEYNPGSPIPTWNRTTTAMYAVAVARVLRHLQGDKQDEQSNDTDPLVAA